MRGVVVGVCSAMVLLSACSGSEPPATLPTLPAASSAPSTAAPVPSDARAAGEFVRQWFAALNEGFAEADSTGLRALSTTDCTTCTNFAKAIDDLAAKRQSVRGGALNVLFAETADFPANVALVDLAYEQAPGEVVDSSGRVVESYPGKPKVLAQARVEHDGQRWTFRAMRLVDAS